MNRNVVVILFIVVIGGAIAALVAYANQYSPKYNWNPELYKRSEEPYGLKIFYDALDKQPQKLATISKGFYQNLDTNKTNTTFLSIGSNLYYDSLKAEHLLKYVEKGNVALIASDGAQTEILRNFFFTTDSVNEFDYYYDSLVAVDFINKELPFSKKINFHHQYLKDTANTYWSGYHKNYFNRSFKKYGFEPFSLIRDTVINSFYIEHGKGKIYFNSTPLLFANYYLIQKNGFEYTNNILSTFNDGEIFWDETSLKPAFDMGGEASAQNNPLQLLFSHYTLRWGWYLFLITVCLYLLFRSKREQRIIPLMPKNTNTTIEYTKAVGVLYFQKKEHKNIANEMYTIYLAEVRARYHITTNVEEKELIEKISKRSEIKKEDIENLFNQFRKIRFSPIANAKDLIKLHQTIEEYHKKRQ